SVYDRSSGKLDMIFVKTNPFLLSRNMHGTTPQDLTTPKCFFPLKALWKDFKPVGTGYLVSLCGSGNVVIKISFPDLNKMEIVLRIILVLHRAFLPMSQNF